MNNSNPVLWVGIWASLLKSDSEEREAGWVGPAEITA